MKPGRCIIGGLLALSVLWLPGCGKPAGRGDASAPEAPPAVSAAQTAAASGGERRVVGEPVRTVTGAAGARTIAARMAALRAAGNNLTGEEQEELLAFLEQGGPVEGMSVESVRWLKNDIMNLLRTQQAPSAKFAPALLRIFRNYGQDVVLRDYALQHLSGWHGQEGDALQRAEIEKTLWDAAGERDGTIGGTALIGLSQMAEAGRMDEAGLTRLGGAALGVAQDREAAVAARVTALQICARRDVAAALPLARELAEQPGDMSLRISAVAAIGQLGGTNDLPLLAQLVKAPENRLQPAAKSALKQVTARDQMARKAALRPAGQ